MMDPFEVYYLFALVTISIILSSIHRRGTSDTGLKVSFGDGYMLGVTDDSSYFHGASVFPSISHRCEIERIGSDRTPAAGLNKRWNLISCLRPAIESHDPEGGRQSARA